MIQDIYGEALIVVHIVSMKLIEHTVPISQKEMKEIAKNTHSCLVILTINNYSIKVAGLII